MSLSLAHVNINIIRDPCNSTTTQEFKKKVPDGGWGWVICIASFLISFIIDGISYSFGLLFVEIDEEFKVSKSVTSWIGSILLGMVLLTAPISSLIIIRYGCITSTVAGTFIASLGFGISYFATNVLYLTFSIGVVGGSGLGLIYLPAVVIIADWFENRLALATGIAVCGSGVGNFVIAPIIAVMTDKIGWRYTLVVSAGILLFCGPLGLTFSKPRNEPMRKPSKTRRPSSGNAKDLVPAPESEILQSVLQKPQPEIKVAKRKEKVVVISDAPASFIQDSSPASPIQDSSPESRRKQEYNPDEARESISLPDLLVPRRTTPYPLNWHRKARLKILHSRTWFLLTDSIYLILIITCFFAGITFNIPYIYLPDLAKEKLKIIEKDDRKGWLISSIGITQTISRLLIGYISDKKWANRLLIYFCSYALFAVSTGALAFCESYTCMIVCASIFGAGSGSYVTLATVVLVDLLGTECLSDAYSILLLSQGIASFLGPPIVGTFYDHYQHYTYGFIFAGSVGTASALLAVFIPIIKCKRNRKKLLALSIASQSLRNTIKIDDANVSGAST